MLRSIKLDDQLCLNTDEVDDVVSDWDLSSKAKTFELPAIQATPKALLGIGRSIPKVSCTGFGEPVPHALVTIVRPGWMT